MQNVKFQPQIVKQRSYRLFLKTYVKNCSKFYILSLSEFGEFKFLPKVWIPSARRYYMYGKFKFWNMDRNIYGRNVSWMAKNFKKK